MAATRWLRLLAVLMLTACLPACVRQCIPDHLSRGHDLIDLCAPPRDEPNDDRELRREVAEEFRRRGAATHPPGTPPYHFLALSGGGLYGSFGVGVLNGWTESGTRPQFDGVTGISAGALISTFAFLGPQYDDMLRETIVGVEQSGILRRKPFPLVPFSDSFYWSTPLARRIERAITPQILCEVAKAHAAGRRLYVGTTTLDTRHLVIWDMGQIATRGTPEALQLYRDVILASSSFPGVFPPIRLPVEIDGARYTELHVDGGVSHEVIFRSFMVIEQNRARGVGGARAPAGSTLHVISNGKLNAEPSCVRPWLPTVLGASLDSILLAKAQDELHHLYLISLETGVNFRLTAVPESVRVEGTSLSLSRKDQELLFAVGRRIGREVVTGAGWVDDPEDFGEAETGLPRAGTRFATTPKHPSNNHRTTIVQPGDSPAGGCAGHALPD